ncbi:MAG: DUF2849 domain-containing protein [Beijerinckiaceae bacterium]|nr:DUF2849 domain-containing protein [Beijerinckiaceae bacterium]
MTKTETTQILISNDLLSGETLFMGQDGWVSDHRRARTAASPEDIAALEVLGKAEMKANKVVDAYLVDVVIGQDGSPEPTHYRERVRTKGPSNRPDLGKQAAFLAGGGA